jgi:protein-tyrosine-phosphatase
MKRFHVHLHVDDLNRSIGFYSQLFAAQPARVEGDYAKWMLEDPPVNFAISTRGSKPGIDHLGIQTDDAEELAVLKARAEAADMALLDEGTTTCCYARSEKHWITDPQGVAWEHFHTLGNIPVFNEAAPAATSAAACCAPVRGKPMGVAVKPAPPAADEIPMTTDKTYNALFICTGNSARSILAEGILNELGQGAFAPTRRAATPRAKSIRWRSPRWSGCMPTAGYRSKSWDEFAAPGAPVLDFIFTVCDNAAGEVCPVWPGRPMSAHWGVPDPAAVEGTESRSARRSRTRR